MPRTRSNIAGMNSDACVRRSSRLSGQHQHILPQSTGQHRLAFDKDDVDFVFFGKSFDISTTRPTGNSNMYAMFEGYREYAIRDFQILAERVRMKLIDEPYPNAWSESYNICSNNRISAGHYEDTSSLPWAKSSFANDEGLYEPNENDYPGYQLPHNIANVAKQVAFENSESDNDGVSPLRRTKLGMDEKFQIFCRTLITVMTIYHLQNRRILTLILTNMKPMLFEIQI